MALFKKRKAYKQYRKIIGNVPAHARFTKKEFGMVTHPQYSSKGTATGRALRAAGVRSKEMRTDLQKALRKSVRSKKRKY